MELCWFVGVLGSVAAEDEMREVGEEPKEVSFPAIHDSALEKKITGLAGLYNNYELYSTTTKLKGSIFK